MPGKGAGEGAARICLIPTLSQALLLSHLMFHRRFEVDNL